MRDALKAVYSETETLDGKGRKPDDDRNGRPVKMKDNRGYMKLPSTVIDYFIFRYLKASAIISYFTSPLDALQ